MSTKPALLPSSLTLAETPKLDIQSDWKTAACMVAVDTASLALVFGLLVVVRHWASAAHTLSAWKWCPT